MDKNIDFRKKDHMIIIFLGVLLSYITYSFVIAELPGNLNDYNGHVYVYLPLFTKETLLEAWQTVPYFMWHGTVLCLNRLCRIPLETSAAYSSCIYSIFTYLIMCWMIQRIFLLTDGEEHTAKAGFLAFALSVVQGLYCYWLNTGGRFLGLYSVNPLHSPTQMCVKGFSLLCLCLVYDIWGKQKNDGYKGVFFQVEKGLKKYYILLAVILLCSVLAKPVFAEMFIPAVGILMLWDWFAAIVRKDGTAQKYFKNCLHMFFCAVPSVIYMLFQIWGYYISGGGIHGENSVIITDFMEVWSLFSENVALSLGMSMAFPLFVILLNPEWFIKSDFGKLSLTGYLIGLLQAAFLGENGETMAHGDFFWPMISGMTLLWMAALLRLVVLEKTQAGSGKKKLLIDIAWVIFALHVLCGYLLIRENIGSIL